MTLYTSDNTINNDPGMISRPAYFRKTAAASYKRKTDTAMIYLFVTMFCVLFGAVYEIFSHGVYSYFMIYAFAFPLVLGVLPFLILRRSMVIVRRSLLAGSLYHLGVAVLTVGSLLNGVLEIYGTTNSLTSVYWIAGGILIASGLITSLFIKRPE